MRLCGEEEPGTGRICDKPMPCYIWHETNGENWGISAEPSQNKPSDRRKQGQRISDNIRVEKPVGPPVLPVLRDRSPQPISDDSMIPDSPEWVDATVRAFYAFLRSRGVSFTTPEDFWPLIDAPADKRAMARVVKEALKLGWIEEIGAKRLRGTYTTKDGQTFKMNKLVSIYVSRVFSLNTASSDEVSV